MLNYHRLLLTTDAVGGVWRYSMELARGLVSHGVRVFLAVLGPAPTEAQAREAAAIPGVKIHLTRLPLDWTAGSAHELDVASRALATLAGRVKADTVQLHAPALLGGATWPAPVIAMVHSCVGTWWQAVHGDMPLPAGLAWRSSATADGLAAADAVLAPSVSFAEALTAYYGLSRQIRPILNGRRPSNGTNSRFHAASAIAPAGNSSVLIAGRLWDEAKGAATIDEAAGWLASPVHGAGPVSPPNGAPVAFCHLRLLGNLDEAAIAQAYAKASIFTSAARYEPFGLSVLEAAQSGCALVLSDIPTFRELWQDAAIFVPPGDAPAYAAALQSLLDDPNGCAEAGRRAQKHAECYDANRMADETWAAHASVLAREAV